MGNIDLIENGFELLKGEGVKAVSVSPDTLVQRYDAANSKLHAYLIAARLSPDENNHRDILQLYRKMEPIFNESEIQELCFELDIDYEDLNGRNRLDKLRELITYMQRRNRLSDLVELCQAKRPRLNWDVDRVAKSETAVQPKLNIAVVVDVARPALRNAAVYLDDAAIDANFLVFRHEQPGTFFDVKDDWQQLAITFGDVMDRLKREFNGVKLHFFLAGPGGLLFAMGCIWGTVDEAMVYHYENNTYYPVVPISRELRQVLSGWI